MRLAFALTALLAFALFLVPWEAATAQSAPAFLVVVHRGNPVASLGRTDVSRMFLKEVARWPGGQPVEPVDQTVSSPVRAAFSQAVHRRSPQSVASYWRQLVFSGRGLPPPEQRSDADVVRFVAGHAGGIGYVSPSATLTNVKTLQVTGL